MIIGLHTIIYSDEADATRASLRDVLGLPSVDAGGGWLIFASPPGELASHPTAGAGRPTGHQELYLMCDDIQATVRELSSKGVEFTTDVSEAPFGLLTALRLPGAGQLWLYEPRHPTALHLGPAGA